MASTKAGEIGPAGQSFLEQAKAMASGHSDGSSGTSGGSGSSGSGGSSSGSGSSGSSGGSPPDTPAPSGSGSGAWGRGMHSVHRAFLGILIVFSSLSIVGYTVWRTTERGVQIQTQENRLEEKKIDLALSKEETKRQRLMRRQTENAPALAPATTPTARTAISSCESLPMEAVGSFRSPIRIESGKCLSREHTEKPLWVTFASPPTVTIAEKDAGIAFYELVPANDGSGRAERLSHCITLHSTDNCRSYLAGKTGTTLWFSSRGRIQINS